MNDLEVIRELFINFDTNGDGTIGKRELQHFIDSIQDTFLHFQPFACNTYITL